MENKEVVIPQDERGDSFSWEYHHNQYAASVDGKTDYTAHVEPCARLLFNVGKPDGLSDADIAYIKDKAGGFTHMDKPLANLAHKRLDADDAIAIMNQFFRWDRDENSKAVRLLFREQSSFDGEVINLSEYFKEGELSSKVYTEKRDGYDVPMPPGAFGELVKDAIAMMPHPNHNIGVVCAFALICSIIGRKFQVNRTGLNLYIVLLADTGSGKSSIGYFVDSLMPDLFGQDRVDNNTTPSCAFNDITTGSVLFNELEEYSSKVIIYSEGGLSMSTTSGDPAQSLKTILDMFDKSRSGAIAKGRKYKDKKDTTKPISSPAMSMIWESTPSTFMQGIEKRGVGTGYAPRTWFIRDDQPKSKLNRNQKGRVSDRSFKKIKACVNVCDADNFQMEQSEGNGGLRLKVNYIRIDAGSRMLEISDKFTDEENKYKKEGDVLKAEICSRAWVKFAKLASIVTVYNHIEEIERDKPTEIKMDDEAIKWALNAINLEINNIYKSMRVDSSLTVDRLFSDIIKPKIIKLMAGDYSGEIYPTEEQRKQNMCTKSALREVLRKNSDTLARELDSLKGYAIKDWFEKLLDYMVKNRMIEKVESVGLLKDSKGKVLFPGNPRGVYKVLRAILDE